MRRVGVSVRRDFLKTDGAKVEAVGRRTGGRRPFFDRAKVGNLSRLLYHMKMWARSCIAEFRSGGVQRKCRCLVFYSHFGRVWSKGRCVCSGVQKASGKTESCTVLKNNVAKVAASVLQSKCWGKNQVFLRGGVQVEIRENGATGIQRHN